MKQANLPISPYKDKCNGFAAVGTEDKQYILGVSVGIGVAPMGLSHSGSAVLDETNAFDLAEIDGPYIGQLNMSIVSSFCGPQGKIWGFDLANNLERRTRFGGVIPERIKEGESVLEIFNGDFLVDALQELFGTVESKKYNIIPGSHTPFASKNIKSPGPTTLYAAIAIGIPKDRSKDACLLMEDVGFIDERVSKYKESIIKNLAKSVLKVGQNQRVTYKECYIVFKSKEIKENEIGCALVSAPYFTLAQKTIPKNWLGILDFNRLFSISLENWKKFIKKLP
jgi:histidine decarboxylase